MSPYGIMAQTEEAVPSLTDGERRQLLAYLLFLMRDTDASDVLESAADSDRLLAIARGQA